MKNTSAIYVVDDDLMITIHLKHQLESCFGEESNLIIETFQEPEIALKTIQENKDLGVDPVVCVVDFQMPGLTGDKFIRKLKECFPSIKCIILSGNSSAILVSELEENDLLDNYLQKPWDKMTLCKTVNDCLPLNLKAEL